MSQTNETTGGCRIGADIGGTFTDVVMIADDGSVFETAKVLTTPARPDDAVLEGVSSLAERRTGKAIDHIVHGTTLFTNALIERKGARTALIATRGFRDAIEIGREHRYDMYDLYMRRPEPLAPRYLRFEVDERIRADGSVLTPLDEASVEVVIGQLRAENVEAVGVCLLHAFTNPVHEQRIGEMLRAAMPEVAVTLASELVPEIREYDRSSTVLANVYVQKLAADYLGRLRSRLAALPHCANAELLVMQSNGGLCEVETASRFPIRLVESGPAAGALAAAHYGQLLETPQLLSFDMGGTTAKACLIVDGEPLISPDFEVDRQYQFKKGSGLPVKVPVIEMIEIGTGGGSIARLDTLDRLQAGPSSAGAVPGPACYARGGRMPTVTDADLLLGYLAPDFFLGGGMALDTDAARDAIEREIARPRGIGAIEAAWSIHQLANENMASAARIHAVERGKEISAFPLFAFGGAGPVHALGVGRILRSKRVIYPLAAGVMSAIGFLTAPIAFDFVRSRPSPLDATDWNDVMMLMTQMEQDGLEILATTTAPANIRFRRFADMRYRKQGYEIRVPVPDGTLDAKSASAILSSFEQTYAALYGHTVPATPVDIVSWRLIASGPKPDFVIPPVASERRDALKGYRSIWLPERNRMEEVPIFDRYLLEAGRRLEGPAIIEERESTVVINSDAQLTVDSFGNVVADIEVST
ncbi:MAG: hydantoinase/oxoprolinase family protein [Geminicoccaceae bacterium]